MKNSIILLNKNLSNQSVIIYSNAEIERLQILSDNKGKTGIYLWTHKESGKMYVGSAIDLSRRLKDYYSPSKLKKTNNYICNALIHHTHSAFSLTILEFIDISHLSKEDVRKLVLEREQFYIDSLEPQYNILLIAGSSLGQKRTEITKALISKVKSGLIHSVETKAKISESLKGKTHSEKTKAKMNLAKIGEKNPNFGKARSIETKAKMSATRGTTIYVYDSKGVTLLNTFTSARKTAEYFNTYNKTILNYCSNGKLFKEQWILSMSKK